MPKSDSRNRCNHIFRSMKVPFEPYPHQCEKAYNFSTISLIDCDTSPVVILNFRKQTEQNSFIACVLVMHRYSSKTWRAADRFSGSSSE
jgi:hypothetical protein